MTGTEPDVIERKPVGASAVLYLGVMLGSFCVTLLVLIGILYSAKLAGMLPPIPLTDSIVFNEKAMFVRGALHERYDIVAAGSSMTLNNLAADVLTEEMPDHPRILNIGAWNMKISDTRRWLEDVLRYTHPKTIIAVTGMMDFYSQAPWLNITDEEIQTFLSDSRTPRLLEFLGHFSLQYYADNWRGMRTSRHSRADYNSLAFDRSGSVPLEVYYPNVDSTRWGEVPKAALVSDEEYAQLAMLAKELRGQGIGLVLVQAPLRRRALIAGGAELDRHWHRLETIMDQSEQKFIDLHALDYDDSHFADYSHLNAKGALAFTRELGHRLTVTRSTP
jgi:hypothetical protein